MPSDVATPRRSEARERLLAAASGLFYTKGVHAVGVDEIISRATVTRATFYRHFPGKDDLVVEYLRAADQQIRAAVEAATRDTSPEDGVRAVARVVAGQIGTVGFRGCAFLNAAAEYPDADDPIRHAVADHRTWFHDAVRRQFARVAGRGATRAADHFVMLRDGAMSEGCLGDPGRVTATFLQGVEGLLREHAAGD